jgi:hypothetical protein
VEFAAKVVVSACAIGVMVYILAAVSSLRLKALLFTFPVLTTIGLIATGVAVDGSHVAGVMLIWVFLGVADRLMSRWRIHAVGAVLVAAGFYIALGTLLSVLVRPYFWPMVGLFLVAWVALVARWWLRPLLSDPAPLAVISAAKKGMIGAGVSAVLLAASPLIAGVVVTFPYQGLFAVVEVRTRLTAFTRSVTCNTIATAAMFGVIHLLQGSVHGIVSLIAGWVVFVAVVIPAGRIRVISLDHPVAVTAANQKLSDDRNSDQPES